jgi:GMP synthase (glutamine-hydrolysing)
MKGQDLPMAHSRPLVVLVAGDPVDSVRREQGGFADLVREVARPAWQGAWIDVDLRDGSPLPGLTDIAGVLVTGSASSVTERAPWMLRAEDYLRSLVRERVPTFGICFGHQLLAEGLGGHVARNPRGREIGTVDVELLAEDPLLDARARPFRANATHVDTVERLPPGATVLARTAIDPHAAVRFSEAAWGVQFHPEMNASAIRGYLETRREIISLEGLDPDALLASADDAAAGASTLRRFVELVRASGG